MNTTSVLTVVALSSVIVLGSDNVGARTMSSAGPTATLFVSGMASGSGSTIGPAGDLYVTESATGRVLRVDPKTGNVSTFASGLPTRIVGTGGAMDIAFIGGTAYVLITLVGPDVGGNDVVGIYRIDGPGSFTVIADIGEFAMAHPPSTPFFVPTGLAVSGNTIYVSEAGPVPHLPQNGKVVSFGPKSSVATDVAAGARLLVDVEFGRGRTLFAISQGVWDGVAEGSPALPNTGALVEVNGNGTFTVVTDGLNQPTSLEVIGNTAYIVTLGGEIWKIEGIAGPPYGVAP